MSPLSGKVAVVTGASRGIGAAIATRLAKDGARVAIGFVEQQAKAKAVVSAIEQAGGHAAAIQADLGNVSAVRRLFADVIAAFGRLDIVVTNAGIARWGAIADLTEADFETVFNVNTRGVFVALQEAARRIADGGRIINMTTSATKMMLPGSGLYTASKAAGEEFARCLAKELAPRGITVNNVSPGFTETDMLSKDPDFRTMAAGMSLLGRIGQPDEIADVVAFLAGPDARWITGQNIQAAGGLAG